MIGQVISHYKILEKVGEGGMGVVYKAHDTRLDRTVALKFLPRDLSPSEEERSRFIHEAKAASALDHPNICTIHEIDETPEGQLFIAMGYYEGISLGRKIERGRLDVEEAVLIAIQIAEGLKAAHEKGIVHRDIKSSNIILTDKGQVKILDFGLAHKSGLSKLTKSGSTVGTAAYMSPEQAQGDNLDHRSDLWSLGVVLYEMVTGKLPFHGAHEAAILYSVVNEEPQPIQALVTDASPELIHIIRRALEKDSADRYQSAEDMLIDLRRLKKDTSRVGFSPVPTGKRKFSLLSARVILPAAVIVLSCLAGYLYFQGRGAEINPAYRLRWLEIPFTDLGVPGISPDGKWVVFGAADKAKKSDLYLIRSTGGEVRRLTEDSSEGVWAANISPDGEQIVYNRWSGREAEICLVAINGGTSKRIGVGVWPKWSPDGKRIGYVLEPALGSTQRSVSGNGEFWTMNFDGTNKHLEFTDSIVTKDILPILTFAWSPDGKSVAWLRKLKTRECEIVIHDLEAHVEHPVISDKSHKGYLSWAPNGQIIYSCAAADEMNLWMVHSTGGTAIQITKGLRSVDFPVLSNDGHTLLLLHSRNTGHLWVASLDGSRRREEVLSNEQYFQFPDISPDGKYISVGMYVTNTLTRQLFVMNRDGTNIRQITQGEVACYKPKWSPDGQLISYYSRGRYEPTDSFKVYVVNPFKLDIPRLVYYGTNESWADSVTLQMDYGSRTWVGYLDGRPARPFTTDSMFARTICNGHYVEFTSMRLGAILTHAPTSICRAEEWNGSGSSKAIRLPVRPVNNNYDGLYHRSGLEIFRISFNDWKMEKLNVNIDDIDTTDFYIRTTADGKEMVYKTTEWVTTLGVIEDLFK